MAPEGVPNGRKSSCEADREKGKWSRPQNRGGDRPADRGEKGGKNPACYSVQQRQEGRVAVGGGGAERGILLKGRKRRMPDVMEKNEPLFGLSTGAEKKKPKGENHINPVIDIEGKRESRGLLGCGQREKERDHGRKSRPHSQIKDRKSTFRSSMEKEKKDLYAAMGGKRGESSFRIKGEKDRGYKSKLLNDKGGGGTTYY